MKQFYCLSLSSSLRGFVGFVAVLIFNSSVMASPVPDFTCDVKPHPDINVEGYLLGQGIYIMSDDRVGLVGYAEPSQQLQRVVSGSGMQFSNGSVTFGAKGDEGYLEMGDGTLFPCKSAALINAGSMNVPAIALGTIIRRNASVSGERIERLPENEPILLIKETGIYHDDFQWFEIEYGEGQRGFAWGGTLCVDTELSGIVIDCRRLQQEMSSSATNSAETPNQTSIIGKSLFGSKIRAEANSAARQTASIAEGTPIEILQETGSFFDGWQWVRIRYGSGNEGYVWGGTICVTQGIAPSGVHANCN